MPKAKHFLVADTESLGLGSRAITFDFAYTIATRKEIVCERSFLVREILTNPRLMFDAVKDQNWREMIGYKLFSHYVPQLDTGALHLFQLVGDS